MRYRGTALEALSFKKGPWRYNNFFAVIDTAYDWKCKPSELGLCDPKDDFAIMTAYTRTSALMRAYDQQQQEEAAERAAARAKKGRR